MKPPRKRSVPQVANLAGRLEECRIRAEYHLVYGLQSFFGSVFWSLEQSRGGSPVFGDEEPNHDSYVLAKIREIRAGWKPMPESMEKHTEAYHSFNLGKVEDLTKFLQKDFDSIYTARMAARHVNAYDKAHRPKFRNKED